MRAFLVPIFLLFSPGFAAAQEEQPASPWKYYEALAKFDGAKTVGINNIPKYASSSIYGEIRASRLHVRCNNKEIDIFIIVDPAFVIGSFKALLRVGSSAPVPASGVEKSDNSAAFAWFGTKSSRQVFEAFGRADEVAFRFNGQHVGQVDFVFDTTGFSEAVKPVAVACNLKPK